MDDQKIEAIFPLSDLQNGILYHSLEKGENYLQQMVISINGYIDLAILEDSFSQLLRNYCILRAVIVYQKIQNPMHVILKQRDAKIAYYDLRNGCANIDDEVQRIIEQDKKEEIILHKDLLVRLKLIRVAECEYHCLLSYHHIILDGWSTTILIGKLFAYYQKLRSGQSIDSEASLPFQKYIEALQRMGKQEAIDYWKAYLSGYDSQASFEEINHDADQYRKEGFQLAESDIKKLQQISADNSVSYNSVFQAILGILINRYTNSDDTVIGMVVTNRNLGNIDLSDSIGLFLNMLPIRFQMVENMTFVEWQRSVHRDTAKSMKYAFLSLNTIQKNCMQGEQFIRLFYNYDSHLKLQGQGNGEASNDLHVTDVLMYDQDNYNFSITVNPFNNFEITFKYNRHYFTATFVKSIGRHFATVLRQVAIQPDIHIQNIALVDQDEHCQLLELTKGTGLHDDATIVEKISVSVGKHADKAALYFQDQIMTYRELDECANSYAQKLYEEGVRKNDLVAIALEKGFPLIISILAMLKLGAVYILIDMDYPENRMRYMLDDSQAMYLVRDEQSAIGGTTCRVIRPPLRTDRLTEFSSGTCHSGQDTVCVIYTSGSTGLPKGVLVSHQSMLNYFYEFIKLYSLNKQDTVLLQCSVSFDVFNQELFPALLTGASLVVVSKMMLMNIQLMKDIIARHCISVISCSPRYLRLLNDADIRNVRLYISAGEALKCEYYTNLIRHSDVYNMYGPTEATICVTYHKCTAKETQVPIGRLVNNSRIYILDKYMNLQPMHVYGEIYIGGIGISKGYLNKAKLTHEKFTPSPFEPGEWLFKTGDIGKWLENGEVYYQNRKDRQFKLRGYRIEPGEIESVILQYDRVEDCYVKLAETDLTQSMIAFIKTQADIDVVSLKAFLFEILPHYMIPNEFQFLRAFPLNTNGKIDNDALVVTLPKATSDANRSLSINEMKLLQVVSDILHRPESEIGLKESFADMGFDSLMLIKLLDRISREVSNSFKITDFYIYKNIEELAEYLEKTSVSHSSLYIKGIGLNAECLRQYGREDAVQTLQSTIPLEMMHRVQGKFESYGLSGYHIACLCISMSLSQVLQANDVPLYVIDGGGSEAQFFVSDTDYTAVDMVEDLLDLFVCQAASSRPLSYAQRPSESGATGRVFVACSPDYGLLSDKLLFDMAFIIEEDDNGLRTQCHFNGNSISHEYIEEILSCLVVISSNLANNEDTV